jgi:DNA polymerase-3 subunit alpha (Gram-positive type)
MHDTVLKFDILGHDNPTILRLLQTMTNVDIEKIPTNDEKVMSLFSSTISLYNDKKIKNNSVGTLGIPECGTNFVRKMLKDTKPRCFDDLIRISGLSHGTDV